jgi:hypothetical protein
VKEIIEKKWNELPHIWDELYEKSKSATPFQSYDFLTFTRKGKPYHKDLFRLFGLKEWNLVLYENGKAIAIAPFLIKRKNGKLTVYLRGHFTVANQLDFIYEDLSYQDFELLMDYVKKKRADASFFLDRISEKSITCAYFKKYFAANRIEEHECYSIPITSCYEDWLKSLSKSARNNLSNRYNRLGRDNIEWSVCFCCGSKMEKCLSEKQMWVYADRFIIKNAVQCGPFKSLITRMLQKYLLRDKMTRWLNRGAGSFHAVLFFNTEATSFASGVICRDKRILLSRLAILTKYARYSPGGILISSMIKHIIQHNNSGDMDIEYLDLSQGGQSGMTYKQAYGGQIHYSYLFYE